MTSQNPVFLRYYLITYTFLIVAMFGQPYALSIYIYGPAQQNDKNYSWCRFPVLYAGAIQITEYTRYCMHCW